MKIIYVPTAVYEPGDKVSTPCGLAVVVDDDLDEARHPHESDDSSPEEVAHTALIYNRISVRIEESTSEHSKGAVVEMDRLGLNIEKKG